MSELALQLIAENKKTRATRLDLGNCGLTELPLEVLECVWVEELILSSEWWEFDPNKKGSGKKNSQNIGEVNKITFLPPNLPNLPSLKNLVVNNNQIADLSPIASLTNLQVLFCNSNQISDLSPIASLTNLQRLFCNSNQISDLYPIASLTNLQILSCAYNQISDLSPIASLTNLQNLSCDSNQISDLSPIASLTNLQYLFFDYNHISDLSPIITLTNLRFLFCNSNQISDLYPIASLTNLQILWCDSNQISDLYHIASLSNLHSLWCSSNQISDLSPIASLTNLQVLSCNFNQISDLPPTESLTNLRILSCNSNQISDLSLIATLINLQNFSCNSNQISDLSPIPSLTNLQNLSCNSNQISDLSPVASLTNLQNLSCNSNQISDLSPVASLTNLQNLDFSKTQVFDLSPILPLVRNPISVKWEQNFGEGILIQNCPLIIPPIEFAQAGNEAILEYFDQLGDDRSPLNEVKVIFLGEGAAGKTSLVKRIRNEDFDAKESQTHGIRIQKTPVQVGNEYINAHIWDFGGQEVMHATHQFFLSRRCVYVLVLNSRTDEKAEYWLKHANSFGGASPVLVVLNKMDENPGYDVNRKQLLEKYPQIVDFFKVSCKENKGVKEFKATLTDQIARSDTRRTPFPKAWAAVKDHFSNMTEDYIESSVFQQVCSSHTVAKAFSQEVLLQFLHDLGVVINFKHLKNFDTQILNPLWLTNGVYRVINSQIVADNKGLLHEEDFDVVINDKRYTPKNTQEKQFHYSKNKLSYIVRVMEAFELCFRLDTHHFVIPQLLPVDEPDFKIEGKVLHFELHFPDFLPDSIFPRLMVKLNPYIKDNLRWRTGMVLYKPSIFPAHARIRADKEDKEIRIDLCGEEPRRLLSYIRETIREIAADFVQLEYQEMVPVPNTKRFIPYEDLTAAESGGEKETFVPELRSRIPIAHLLDGVEEPSMRGETAQMPVKVFVSYSHEDLDYLQELRAALSPLERLQKLKIWDDRDINAGLDWEKEIFRELEEADIVLCMVSADFINSDFCYSKELAAALEAHRAGKKEVVPIRLRECHWGGLEIAKLQGIPTSNWICADTSKKDKLWTEVARHLEPVVAKVKEQKVKNSKAPFKRMHINI